ncbi:MAG: hypothetical protein WCB58_08840 [Acidobacteriaceae bacterium]
MVTILETVPSTPRGEVVAFSPKPSLETAAIQEVPSDVIPEESRHSPVQIDFSSKADLKLVLWILLAIAVASLLAIFL